MIYQLLVGRQMPIGCLGAVCFTANLWLKRQNHPESPAKSTGTNAGSRPDMSVRITRVKWITRIQIFVAGLGLYDQSCAEDELAPLNLLPALNPVKVVFDGNPAESIYQGGAPGAVCALGQINARVKLQPRTSQTPFNAEIFADGFESGDTSAWSSAIP